MIILGTILVLVVFSLTMWLGGYLEKMFLEKFNMSIDSFIITVILYVIEVAIVAQMLLNNETFKITS